MDRLIQTEAETGADIYPVLLMREGLDNEPGLKQLGGWAVHELVEHKTAVSLGLTFATAGVIVGARRAIHKRAA